MCRSKDTNVSFPKIRAGISVKVLKLADFITANTRQTPFHKLYYDRP